VGGARELSGVVHRMQILQDHGTGIGAIQPWVCVFGVCVWEKGGEGGWITVEDECSGDRSIGKKNAL
jgi:hypothetical protein